MYFAKVYYILHIVVLICAINITENRIEINVRINFSNFSIIFYLSLTGSG